MNAALPRSATQRILVIDDEDEIGELVAAAAESVGLACTALTSAQHLDEAIAPGVEAVMLDLMLPGMDGIELVRLLADRACRAPVVLMSGHDKSVLRSAEQLAKSLGLRTAGPLQKPFRIAEVENLIRSLVASETPQPARAAPCSEPLTEAELREAVQKEQIVVHYQPQIHLGSGRVSGVEALVRVLHPERGIVFPDSFIAKAEELNLIDDLTQLVVKRAFQEMANLPRLADASLSVNVSARSLVDLMLPERLAQAAESSRFPLPRLVVEITESGLIKELGKALDILARLRLRGVGLSIDDFGTGYSSLAQLRRIPSTELKIDRMFVNDMLNDVDAHAMVEETIGLAHRLGLRVVAEGVETALQAQALGVAGCDFGQGYHFARPIAAAELDRWLAARPVRA